MSESQRGDESVHQQQNRSPYLNIEKELPSSKLKISEIVSLRHASTRLIQ